MIFTRVFLATRGSVLAMILMRAAANLAFNTVPVFATEGGNDTRTLLLALLYLVAGRRRARHAAPPQAAGRR
jgi:pyruvate carboxylase